MGHKEYPDIIINSLKNVVNHSQNWPGEKGKVIHDEPNNCGVSLSYIPHTHFVLKDV